MTDNDRIWNGKHDPEIDENKPCDICESTENVQQATVDVPQSNCGVKRIFPYVLAYMCMDCSHKGWAVFGKAHISGNIAYRNIFTENLSIQNSIKCYSSRHTHIQTLLLSIHRYGNFFIAIF